MQRLPFSTRLGALICLIGEALIWVSLFLPYVRFYDPVQFDSFFSILANVLFAKALQSSSLLITGMLIIFPLALLLPPIISITTLWSKRSLFFALISCLLVFLGLLSSILVGLNHLLLLFSQDGTTVVKGLGIGFFLLPVGFIIGLWGASLQLKRGQWVAVVQQPAAVKQEKQAKKSSQKFSYFQDKAMNLQRDKGRLRD